MKIQAGGLNDISLEELCLDPAGVLGKISDSTEALSAPVNLDDNKLIRSYLEEIRGVIQIVGVESADSENFEKFANQIDLELRVEPINQDVVKKLILQASFSIFAKHGPKILTEGKNEDIQMQSDHESQKWRISFYKMLRAEKGLEFLRGKEVFDPCAGSCTLAVEAITYLGCKSIVCGDLCFPGGKPIVDSMYYAPKQNLQIYELIFKGLPEWARPDISSRIKGLIVADATAMPLKDNSFDYVLSDPPFGMSCPINGPGILIDILKESLRISRNGAVVLILTEWEDFLNEKFKDLKWEWNYVTPNLSDEGKKPMAYAHVRSLGMDNQS